MLRVHYRPPELPPSPHLAGADPETGLFDRAGLLERLEQEVSRSLRYQRPLSLAVLFPQNGVGDQLRSCAGFIRTRLRAPDLLGHLGGGVFALGLPESPLGAARGICARIIPELHHLTGVLFKNKAADVAIEGRLVVGHRLCRGRRIVRVMAMSPLRTS